MIENKFGITSKQRREYYRFRRKKSRERNRDGCTTQCMDCNTMGQVIDWISLSLIRPYGILSSNQYAVFHGLGFLPQIHQ